MPTAAFVLLVPLIVDAVTAWTGDVADLAGGLFFAPLGAAILARAISGTPARRLGLEGPLATVGTLCALATVASGVVLGGIAIFAVVPQLWHGPTMLANTALGWLGAALLVDQGLALLFTRPLPWRNVPFLAAFVASPGALAGLILTLAVVFRPERHLGPYAILPDIPAILGLACGVLLTGPVPSAIAPFLRTATALTGLAFVAAVPVYGANGPDVALALCGVLLLWHGLAGPVTHPKTTVEPSPLLGHPLEREARHLLPARLPADPVRATRKLVELGG